MGEVFAGRYELADPIGRGGAGAVWRAWDHRRRRYVAAKVLLQSDAHTLLRFVREQALRIDHPHVLAPASWAADDDKVLFTMDLVAGGSLAHLIGDYGPLPPSFVCLLLDQLLSGLTAVHAEGVVHRDIKPANILLEATGTARPHLRLSDFGIAMRKGEPRLTVSDYVVGTPGYFAPEQAMGGEPDFPADLFAVGLVALYLLQGARPDSRALIEHFTDYGTPGAPRGVPGPLWTVVAGLLQPDPEARFRSATGARKALLAASELLPEPGPDDVLVEVLDQLGALPPGFTPNGPTTTSRQVGVGLAPPISPTSTGSPISPVRPASPALVPGPPTYAPAVPDVRSAESGAADRRTEEPDSGGTDTADIRMSKTSTAETGTATNSAATTSTESTGTATTRMSDTGSFHLPPPPPAQPPTLPTAPLTPAPGQTAPEHAAQLHPPAPQEPPHTPAPTRPHPHEPSPQNPYAASPAPTVPQPPPAPLSISTYTGRSDQVPVSGHPVSARPEAHPRPHRRVRKRRPGPPPQVAIPVLFVALISFAVGIWALTQA
ncbi:protein kinase [Streptomyces sp. NPDC046821]|uniref:serine/threonine-protein kinase n=1 Tax=Streptomyces sp. NPDC046821 TaxID=3154702 RepID=UPI0033EFB827